MNSVASPYEREIHDGERNKRACCIRSFKIKDGLVRLMGMDSKGDETRERKKWGCLQCFPSEIGIQFTICETPASRLAHPIEIGHPAIRQSTRTVLQ